jgi:hypothetical protein
VIFKFTYRLILLPFLVGFFSYAQESTLLKNEAETDTLASTFYREDQIYLGVSFVALVSDQEAFDARGLSSHFQWGFVRDFPMVPSGKFALGVGLGMGFERYNTNLNKTDDFQGRGSYSFNEDTTSDPLFFSIQSLELPLSFRWRSSSATDYAFWRIYGGIAFQWNYRLRAEQNDLSLSVRDDLQHFGATTHLSFGYNTWNFYLAYRLTPFFNKDSLSSQWLPLKLAPIKVGLIFYLL